MYVCSDPVMSHPHRLVLEGISVDIIAGNAPGKGLLFYGVMYPSQWHEVAGVCQGGNRVSLVIGLWQICLADHVLWGPLEGVIYLGRAGCSLRLAGMIFGSWCVSDHRVE